jgi:hypothetical protein
MGYIACGLLVIFFFYIYTAPARNFRKKHRLIDDWINYFSKIGIAKNGEGYIYGEYQWQFIVKKNEPKIFLIVQDNGNWSLIFQNLGLNVEEHRLLSSVGINKDFGTFEYIVAIVEGGKSRALVNML